MSSFHPFRALDGRHRQTVEPVREGRKRVGRRGREPGPTRGGRGGAAIGAALVAALSFPSGVGAGGLPGPVEEILARHRLPAESLSVLVQDVAASESIPLVSHRADVPRHPASTIKLLTTLAALEELGPAYVWETAVHVTGPVRDGRLEGDLVLVGGGDPFLVVEQVWRLLAAVRARGLHEVTGRLVIDNTRFSVAGEPPPGEFDDKPYRAYNAPPDALLVNFNALDVVVEAREGKVRAWTNPPVAGLRVRSRLALSAGGCARRDLRFEVSGPLSVRVPARRPPAHPHRGRTLPARLCARCVPAFGPPSGPICGRSHPLPLDADGRPDRRGARARSPSGGVRALAPAPLAPARLHRPRDQQVQQQRDVPQPAPHPGGGAFRRPGDDGQGTAGGEGLAEATRG